MAELAGAPRGSGIEDQTCALYIAEMALTKLTQFAMKSILWYIIPSLSLVSMEVIAL